MTVDVSKNVPFYSPDFFFFRSPSSEIFVGGPPARIFSSFFRFGDGHVCAQ